MPRSARLDGRHYWLGDVADMDCSHAIMIALAQAYRNSAEPASTVSTTDELIANYRTYAGGFTHGDLAAGLVIAVLLVV